MTLPASTKTVLGKKLPSQGIGGVSPEFVSEFSIGDYRVGGKVSSFDNALNFSRTGPATYTDATGTLQTVADGVPRTDHHIWDGSAWVNEMRFESDAATNLLTYSEQFDNGVWPKTRSSITPNATTAPDGTVTADKFVEDASSNSHFIRKTGFASEERTLSIHVKAGERNWIMLFTGSVGATRTWFDIQNGTVGTSEHTDAGIEFSGDGWYRVWVVDASQVEVGLQLASANAISSYTGDGTSGIFVWGAQLEPGSIPTSYIRTEATTETRNAEILTASSGNLPYNLTAVSIQMEGTVSGTPSTLIDWQADASNLITLSAGASDFTFTQEQGATVDSVTGGTYTPSLNVPFNIASRHGSTFINGAVDGTALTANTTPTALPDLTTTDLEIAPNFNGTIKLLRIWGSDIGDTGIAQASA